MGLGQIGGSICAGLKKRGLCRRLVGITRRRETARRAQSMGILDDAGVDLRAVHAADVVVLAAPVRTLLKHVTEVGRRLPPEALLTDVGSTKAEFLREVRRAKLRCSVVGGHPMAGNEKQGLDGVDPDLFVDRPWILIGADPRAEALARGLGARPVRMDDADAHDYAVALVSHVPYFAAYALMSPKMARLDVAGNSFRDATRVAASDVEMSLDIYLTNRKNVRKALEVFISELRRLERALGREPDLRKLLQSARARRLDLH